MVNKQKILIVDDDNNIAELISLYLAKECFEDETEDIVRRYSHKVWSEIHKQYIAAIKAEYRRREVLNGQKL